MITTATITEAAQRLRERLVDDDLVISGGQALASDIRTMLVAAGRLATAHEFRIDILPEGH